MDNLYKINAKYKTLGIIRIALIPIMSIWGMLGLCIICSGCASDSKPSLSLGSLGLGVNKIGYVLLHLYNITIGTDSI